MFKVSDRVFQIGDIFLNIFILNDIIDILDKGSKFVPCLHFNQFHIFKDLLFNFDKFIPKFNQYLSFTKSKLEKSFLNSFQNSTSTSEIELNITSTSNSETCSSLDCFFKKVKKSPIPFSILETETIDFKFDFYKYISTCNFTYKKNLSFSQIESLFYFVKNKPFKVAECDKNVGICILDHKIYDDYCNSLLSDTNTYGTVNSDPLNLITQNLNILLDELVLNKDISKKLRKKLVLEKPKLGKFRILFKLHKSKLGLRPIINCKSHPTSLISLLIDLILQPFIRNLITFILDSQNLIQITENLIFPSDSKLSSCDFDSLFTNIDLKHALLLITDFISKNFFCDELKTTGFHKLLKFLFENNYFIYSNKIYKQIKGVAMGSKCAPSIANLYIFILEKSFLTLHKPLFFKRFVDDIFTITKKDFDMNFLKNHFEYLSLNIITEKTVNFLDLLISLDTITGHLVFKLYLKPTNTFSYLLNSSNHPSSIFKNVPKGVLFRVRRICTFLFDFYYFARLFHKQFLKRGYTQILVDKTIRMIAGLDRNKIIQYNLDKKASNFDFANNLFFKLPFNFNYINLEKFFSKYIVSSNCLFQNTKLKLLNSINPSVSSIFIHDFKIKKPTYYCYKKCSKLSCKFCCFANTNSFLELTNSFYFPIMRNSSCNSLNLIYIIYCKSCLFFYIGQTKNLKNRFNRHKRNINLNIQNDETTKLVKHFNLPNHSLKNFSFYIFKTDIEILLDRLIQENQLCHLFKKLEIPILNDRLPDIDHYKKISALFDKI